MDATPVSLLERLRRQSDESAWKRLFALYTPLVRRWLCQLGVPEADLDDLQQDVLGVVVRELPHFEHNAQRGAFRRWLRLIAVNRLRGYWRGRKHAVDGPDDHPPLDELVDPASDLSRRWDQEHNEFVARRLLELLEPEFTPSTWQAFRRQVLDGLKAAAVADELGTTPNAVLIAKSRVLRRLRQEVQGLLD